jgi:hypothetical protein
VGIFFFIKISIRSVSIQSDGSESRRSSINFHKMVLKSLFTPMERNETERNEKNPFQKL